jgi:2-haloacid dehalogenase
MPQRPLVVAFDLIETLVSLGPVRDKLVAAGLPGYSTQVFFTRLLRDAFALEVSGVYKPFGEIAAAVLEVVMADHNLAADKADIRQALSAFAELPAHPDVRPTFEQLRDAGVRVAVFSNGAADTMQKILTRAGLDGLVDKTISIDDARHWKPARAAYLHAAKACEVDPARMALVAAHAWDVHGAKQAGLVGAWVQRNNEQFLSVMGPPDVWGRTLEEVAEGLLALKE